MILKGKDALVELVDKLTYNTETGVFFIDANDLVVGDVTNSPHPEEHGEISEINTTDCES